MINAVITGSGHYLPNNIIKNDYFLNHDFYDEQGNKIEKPNQEIIDKFKEITEIEERRYLDSEMMNSEMAAIAGQRALDDAGVDKEDLDYVMVAHNFGNIDIQTQRVDIMPSISARVKNHLGIKNNRTRPYDMNFGCPGWVELMILGTQLIQAGVAKKMLLIGSDTLSRAVDPHDRTAMIFADGAGAVVLEAKEGEERVGVLSYITIADNLDELSYLTNGPSLNTDNSDNSVSVTMKGRKVYEYALRKVPAAIKRMLDDSGLDIKDVNMVLLHQANAKMDHAMVQRLYKLYGITDIPKNVAPMTVQNFGNSSVATVPTMYDLISKHQLGDYEFHSGDIIVMASVGAGMSINAITYKMP